MPCYHPLKAFYTGFNEDGKRDIHFFNFQPERFPFEFEGHLISEEKVLSLPCGQCVGCRLQRSRVWANRCMMELLYHDSAYFVTLTYDDDHVPVSHYADPATGEIFDSLTLSKRDLQLFMKRLRRHFSNDKIRFFACGEYGGKTFRPHYHLILFGLHLNDLVVYKRSPQGHIYYNSDSLQSCWLDCDGIPIGYAVAADVSWETCAYTARYVLKKLTGEYAQFYSNFNIEPEFVNMSRKPGIARQYYDDHPDLYDFEFINVPTPTGGRKFRPPAYFDKLYDLEHPDEMRRIKEIRIRMAVAAQRMKLDRTSLSVDEILQVEEDKVSSRIKSLRRPLYE